MSIAILTFSLLMQVSTNPQVRPGAVTGIVVKQETGEPLSKASVVLTSEAQPGPKPVTVTTSAEGKFAFENVAPGRYKIAVTRNGYAKAEYGDRGGNGCGSAFTVSAGQRVENLRLGMMPAGIISGRLVDHDGEPASDVNVQALRWAYQNGKRVLEVVQTAQTNDLGEYRLYWLTPGRYYVSVAADASAEELVLDIPMPQPGLQPTRITSDIGALLINPPSGRTGALPVFESAAAYYERRPAQQYAPLYFPGTPDPKAASSIELRPGEIFTGANMSLTMVRASRITGTIAALRPGENPRSMAVRLIPRFAGPVAESTARTALMKPDGHFDLPSVIAGAYFLTATGSDSAGRFYGRVAIDVGEADIENMSIPLSRGTEVSGRITVDDPEAFARLNGVALRSLTEPSSAPILQNSNLSADIKDGVFKIGGVPPGDYIAVFTFVAPANIYVKSLRLNTQDARNGFRLDGQPSVQLDVELGAKGGVVDGVVVNEQQQPVPGATVVLVPEPFLRQRSTLYRSGTSDPSGKFHFEAIAAGEYKLFAWEAVERGAWEDADFIGPFEGRGKAVTFLEGTGQTVQIPVIPSTGPLYGQCEQGTR